MFLDSIFALAGGGGAGGGSAFSTMIPFVLMFGIFYFLLIRPQQKKAKNQKNWLTALRKGDRVLTSGGLHGQITGMTDTVITLEIAPKVRVKVSRASISGPLGNPTPQTNAEVSEE